MNLVQRASSLNLAFNMGMRVDREISSWMRDAKLYIAKAGESLAPYSKLIVMGLYRPPVGDLIEAERLLNEFRMMGFKAADKIER